MKKNLYIYIIIFIGCLVAVSCQKAPINGDLDGQWEVTDIIPEPSKIIIKERLFYNFSLHVCQLTFYGGYFLDGIIDYDNDFLTIDFPYNLSANQKEILAQYGIEDSQARFNVRFLNKKNLLLENYNVSIKLKKIE